MQRDYCGRDDALDEVDYYAPVIAKKAGLALPARVIKFRTDGGYGPLSGTYGPLIVDNPSGTNAGTTLKPLGYQLAAGAGDCEAYPVTLGKWLYGGPIVDKWGLMLKLSIDADLASGMVCRFSLYDAGSPIDLISLRSEYAESHTNFVVKSGAVGSLATLDTGIPVVKDQMYRVAIYKYGGLVHVEFDDVAVGTIALPATWTGATATSLYVGGGAGIKQTISWAVFASDL